MILLAAIGGGLYILLFAGAALMIFKPVVYLLVYRAKDLVVKKRTCF